MSGSNIYFDSKQYQSQTFTSDGTFNVPAGVYEIYLEMWGGGGAGGYADNGLAYGGEPGQTILRQLPVTPLQSFNVVIGQGGAGVTSATLNLKGNDGTDTTFGSFKAAGGKGGGVLGVTLISNIILGGQGVGRNSHRANGGANGTNTAGGDAGYENGGNGSTAILDGGNGGLAAGGGGAFDGRTSGDGGDGICIVYWKVD